MKIAIGCLLLLAALTKPACHSKKAAISHCYKGRLEIKSLCMNYTIKVLDGNIDTALVAAQWRDGSTGKTYTNVFGLASRCNFPSTIKEGDEFYFAIDSTSVQDCAVCMAYYPTPEKKLSIKVLAGGCP